MVRIESMLARRGLTWSRLSSVLPGSVVALLGLVAGRADAVQTLCGDISTSTTLTSAGGPYLVTCPIRVSVGVALTVEAGAILKFQPLTGLTIEGTFVSQGTSQNPVVFTSYRDDDYGNDTNGDGPSSGSPGDWAGVILDGGSYTFSGCLLRFGGANAFPNSTPGVVAVLQTKSGFTGSILDNAIDACAPTFVAQCDPFSCTLPSVAIVVNSACTVSNNMITCPVQDWSHNGPIGIEANASGSQVVGNTVTGAVRGILVGGASGGVVTRNRVVAASGGQSGIGISLGSSGPGNTLSNNYVAGPFSIGIDVSGSGAVTLDADTLLNCDNGFTSEGCTAGISNAVFLTGAQHGFPYYLRGQPWPSISGAAGTGASWYPAVALAGEIMSDASLGALYSLGLAVAVRDGFTVGPKATLHIPAGSIVKLWRDARIHTEPGGVLDCQGTPGSPVVFTSFQDDEFGGDTNADGPSTGQPGDWGGVDLSDGSYAFSNCLLRFGGISNAAVPVVWGRSGYTGIISGNTIYAGSPYASFDNNGPEFFAGVGIAADGNCTITGNTISYISRSVFGPDAIEVRSAAANVTNNAITGATMGIVVDGSRSGIVSQNTVSASTIGLLLRSVGGLSVSANAIHGDAAGAKAIELSATGSSCSLGGDLLDGSLDIGIDVAADAGQAVSVSGCSVTGCAQYGIRVLSGSPTITDCSFHGNAQAVANLSPVVTDARGNWWGDPTGPLDASQGTPDYNPGGHGDPVSDNVRYRPWSLTRPLAAPTHVVATRMPCSGTVSIHWEDNATDETAYEVEVDFLALENTVGWTNVGLTPPNVTQYGDSPGGPFAYRYRVRAWRGADRSAWTTSNVVNLAPDLLYRPVNLTAKSVGDGTHIHIQFALAANGAGVSSVELDAAEDLNFQIGASHAAITPRPGPLQDYDYSASTPATRYFRIRSIGECGGTSQFTGPVQATPRRAPVLFVHGICEHPSDWQDPNCNWPLEFAQGYGLRSKVFDDFEHDDGRWPDQIHELQEMIASRLAAGGPWAGDEKVDIVAHSQGGLVSRGLIELTEDGPSMVRKLVMIATPNHGGLLSTAAVVIGVAKYGITWLSPFDLVCQTAGFGGAPGLVSLVGGCPSLNTLNYGATTMDGETNALWICGGHPGENLGPVRDGRVEYWTLAGTDAGFLKGLKVLSNCLVFDGVVPLESARLAGLDAINPGHQFRDVDLKDVGPLVHSAGVKDGHNMYVSTELTHRVAEMLIDGHPLTSGGGGGGGFAARLPADEPPGAPPDAILGAFVDSVAAGATLEMRVRADSSTALDAVIGWDAMPGVLGIRSPSGTTYTPLGSNGFIEFTRDDSLGLASVHVPVPEPGVWSLIVPAATAPKARIISFWTVGGSPYRVEVHPSASLAAPGATVTVVARLARGSASISAGMTGELVSPSGLRSSVPFNDAGLGGDAVAGDLSFSATLAAGAEEGVWSVVAVAAVDRGGDPKLVRTGIAQFVVGAEHGLSVLPGSIVYSPVVPAAYDSVVVSARIRNDGADFEPGARFELRDLSTGQSLCTGFVTLAAGESTGVTMGWRPVTPGDHVLALSVESQTLSSTIASAQITVPVRENPLVDVKAPGPQRLQFLGPAIPNPITDAARFQFGIARGGRVRLEIYDIAGRRVRRLVDEDRPPGQYELRWQGTDDSGRRAPTGVYLVRLTAPGFRAVRTAVLLH
jgi:parallel beta-helix repeat protein